MTLKIKHSSSICKAWFRFALVLLVIAIILSACGRTEKDSVDKDSSATIAAMEATIDALKVTEASETVMPQVATSVPTVTETDERPEPTWTPTPQITPSGVKFVPISIDTTSEGDGWVAYQVLLAAVNQGDTIALVPSTQQNEVSATIVTEEGFEYEGIVTHDWWLDSLPIPPHFQVNTWHNNEFSIDHPIELTFRSSESSHPVRAYAETLGEVDLSEVVNLKYPTDSLDSQFKDIGLPIEIPEKGTLIFEGIDLTHSSGWWILSAVGSFVNASQGYDAVINGDCFFIDALGGMHSPISDKDSILVQVGPGQSGGFFLAYSLTNDDTIDSELFRNAKLFCTGDGLDVIVNLSDVQIPTLTPTPIPTSLEGHAPSNWQRYTLGQGDFAVPSEFSPDSARGTTLYTFSNWTSQGVQALNVMMIPTANNENELYEMLESAEHSIFVDRVLYRGYSVTELERGRSDELPMHWITLEAVSENSTEQWIAAGLPTDRGTIMIETNRNSLNFLEQLARGVTYPARPLLFGIEVPTPTPAPEKADESRAFPMSRQFAEVAADDVEKQLRVAVLGETGNLSLEDINGEEVISIETGIVNANGIMWAPSGKALLVDADNDHESIDIHLVNVATGEVKKWPDHGLQIPSVFQLKWSPTSERVAVNSISGEGWQLDLVDPDGSSLVPVYSNWIVNNTPFWTPYGKHLVVAGSDTGYLRLQIIDGETGEIQDLTPDGVSQAGFGGRWLESGTLIYGANRNSWQQEHLFASSDGTISSSNPTQALLTTPPAEGIQSFLHAPSDDFDFVFSTGEFDGPWDVYHSTSPDFYQNIYHVDQAVAVRPVSWNPNANQLAVTIQRNNQGTEGSTIFFKRELRELLEEIDPSADLDRDGEMEIAGAVGTFEVFRQGVVSEDGKRFVKWIGNKRVGKIEIQSLEWSTTELPRMLWFFSFQRSNPYSPSSAWIDEHRFVATDFTGEALNWILLDDQGNVLRELCNETGGKHCTVWAP